MTHIHPKFDIPDNQYKTKDLEEILSFLENARDCWLDRNMFEFKQKLNSGINRLKRLISRHGI